MRKLIRNFFAVVARQCKKVSNSLPAKIFLFIGFTLALFSLVGIIASVIVGVTVLFLACAGFFSLWRKIPVLISFIFPKNKKKEKVLKMTPECPYQGGE